MGGVAPLLLLPLVAMFLRESPEFLAIRLSASTNTQAVSTGNRAVALFTAGVAGPTTLLWAMGVTEPVDKSSL